MADIIAGLRADRWFDSDCQHKAKEAWERASKDPGKEVLIGSFKVLLLILYYVRDKQGGTIKVVEAEKSSHGPYRSQVFTWQHDGETRTFQIIISQQQLQNYPGITEHREVLQWGGFLH